MAYRSIHRHNPTFALDFENGSSSICIKKRNTALSRPLKKKWNPSDIVNSTSRVPESLSKLRTSEAEDEEERQAEAHFISHSANDADNGFDTRPLRMGDLVELERLMEDRESIIGVYIRSCNGNYAQMLTMTGRWVLTRERQVPFSIPGWVSPALVEPLLEHLPDVEDVTRSRSGARR